MATTTIKQIYDKAPAVASGDDDILLIAQNEPTKGVKLKDVTAGKAVNATDAKYAAHLGADGAPLSVGTEKTPIYIDKNGTPKVCPAVAATTADAAAYAQKIGTPQAHPAIGNTFTPIFINDDGNATACTEIHATLGNTGSAGIPVYTKGNTVRECANFGVCQTATNTMDKAVTIKGFVRKAGAHFYVKFANDGGGTRGTYNLTLNVHDGNNYTGAAPVYVGKYQCGIGAINAGCVYEMLYDGEHYVILNSDIVAQETSENASYIKHGNGFLIQYVRGYAGSAHPFQFPISFSSRDSYSFFPALDDTTYSDKLRGFSYNVIAKSPNHVSLQVQMQNSADGNENVTDKYIRICAMGC